MQPGKDKSLEVSDRARKCSSIFILKITTTIKKQGNHLSYLLEIF